MTGSLPHLEGTMEGWYADSQLENSAVVAHWVTFFFHLITTFYLGYVSFRSKGPTGKSQYFAGYHEEYNIAVYVNMLSAISYFGKVVADTYGHNYQNVGPFIIGLGNYRYADYMATCPLLVMDLLYQLRAPYKISCAMLIFAVLLIGCVTNFYPGDEMRGPAIAWFCFGCFWYCIAYVFMAHIVAKQYGRLYYLAHGTHAEGALLSLKLAILTFFAIWIAFPLVWLLSSGTGLIDNTVAEVCHCICDVVAKSVYGFALSNFREHYDRELYGLLNSIGMDGEDVVAQLEKEMQTNHHKKIPKQGSPQQAHSLNRIGLKSFIERKSSSGSGGAQDSSGSLINSPAILPHLAPRTAIALRRESSGGTNQDMVLSKMEQGRIDRVNSNGWVTDTDLPGTPSNVTGPIISEARQLPSRNSPPANSGSSDSDA